MTKLFHLPIGKYIDNVLIRGPPVSNRGLLGNAEVKIRAHLEWPNSI